MEGGIGVSPGVQGPLEPGVLMSKGRRRRVCPHLPLSFVVSGLKTIGGYLSTWRVDLPHLSDSDSIPISPGSTLIDTLKK